MQKLWPTTDSWHSHVILTVGVVATILMALLLSLADGLQMRPPPPLPTQVVAVAEGDEQTATATAVPPTIPLPTATQTPIVETATATVTGTTEPDKKPSATPGSMVIAEQCGVVPDDWVAYVVRPGDTLFRLSMNSGATVSALMVANCLDSTRLYWGMTLHLPAAPPPPPPVCSGPPADWPRYAVQRGDTLFSLARSRGLTVYQVMSANCLVSTRINAGQVIYLPALAPTPTVAPTATDVPPPPPPPPPSATSPPPTATTQPPTSTATSPAPTATSPPPTATVAPPTATVVPPTATVPPPTATVPSPTATVAPPTATATETAAPPTATTTTTAVPPTATAQPPTATVQPSETPQPTDTPAATGTAQPTGTAQATETLPPSETQGATDAETPLPATPVPTSDAASLSSSIGARERSVRQIAFDWAQLLESLWRWEGGT